MENFRRIFYLEDDETILENWIKLLKMDGHQVNNAKTVLEGLEKIDQYCLHKTKID